MSITYTYINKQDGHVIDEKSIVTAGKDGIVEAGLYDSMRFTPIEDIELEKKSASGGYSYEKKLKLPERPDLDPATPDKIDGSSRTRTAYYFGIDSIEAANQTVEETSAYLSPWIDIGPGSYIQLEVDVNQNSAVEYSIIEGEAETPILPVGISEILYEKLYWNLPTRFMIDQTKKVTILKNGVETTISRDMISAEEYGANSYAIRYTPASQSHNYTTKGNKIRVKVVQRCVDDMLPAVIRHMTIHRFGGDDVWNIKG